MALDPKSPSMTLWHWLLSHGASEDEATELMNDYAHELAERIRYADYPAHATDGAEYAAHVIDPHASQPGRYVLSTQRPGTVSGLRKLVALSALAGAVLKPPRRLSRAGGAQNRPWPAETR